MGIIQNLFPKYCLKREIAKLQLQNISRAYEGGKVNDFHKVVGSSSSPNGDMQNAGESLRNRARYFDENHDIVTGIFDTLVNNIVGNADPIRPLVRNKDGSFNTEYNLKLKHYWRQWSVNPTICGQYTLMQALKMACRAWLRDGEYLTRIVKGPQSLNQIVPLSLELIEADYLPYELSIQKVGKNRVIQGVELNDRNMVLAFYLLKNAPDDFYDFKALSTTDTTRIPSEEIIHLKYVRRTHQVRGLTILHSVMLRLDDLKDYEESERIAARVAAAMTGFIQKAGETQGTVQPDGSRTFEMSPGMIFDNLLPGETINTIASNRPNTGLMDFRSAMLKAIAAGTNTNYSTISKNYDGTYSSQRQELLETKPAYEALRQNFVDSYLAPIWREFVSMLVTTGKVPTSGIDLATIGEMETRGIDIGWIDPKKQADATAISIKAGITSRQQVIRDSNGDPETVFSEIEEEEKFFGPLNQEEKTENTGDADAKEEQESDQE